MAHFGCHVRGEKSLEPKHKTLNYHWADRNGWMYLCRCMPGIRIAGKIKWAFLRSTPLRARKFKK